MDSVPAHLWPVKISVWTERVIHLACSGTVCILPSIGISTNLTLEMWHLNRCEFISLLVSDQWQASFIIVRFVLNFIKLYFLYACNFAQTKTNSDEQTYFHLA